MKKSNVEQEIWFRHLSPLEYDQVDMTLSSKNISEHLEIGKKIVIKLALFNPFFSDVYFTKQTIL